MKVSQQFPFETIVVATDFSERSNASLRYAQAIAQRHGAKIVLVHVIDPIGYAFPTGAPSFLASDTAAREELALIEEDTQRKGIPVHSVVQTGNICELVLQAVRDCGGKLLVLGTRGKTETGRVALGTIARQLLTKSPCPILTITPDVEPLLPWAGRWRKVLLATDFSPSSLLALTSAHRIAHVQFIVLHTVTSPTQAETRCSLERLRYLAPFNESHTVPVEHIVAAGESGPVIAKCARDYGVDLVVLGAPSRILSEENLNSSTVLQVISGVSCPVLCMSPIAQPSAGKLPQIREHVIAGQNSSASHTVAVSAVEDTHA